MASVHDVAAFILKARGPMTAMKLQKLAYYAQAWSLVWDEKALFPERIEAWAAGPVVPDLYACHRGEYMLTEWPKGLPGSLTSAEKATVEAVLGFYGDKTSQWLSDLTHMESPWKDARAGLASGERGNREITPAAMSEYYGGLPPDQTAEV